MKMLSRFKALGVAAMLAAFLGLTMVGCGGQTAPEDENAPDVPAGRSNSEMQDGGPVAKPPEG